MTRDPIDVWIKEFGLDAEIDRIIRTCGYDAVQESVKSAPRRFKEADERLPGNDASRGPGAPLTRDQNFYEVLRLFVEAAKSKNPELTDKQACHEVFRVLAKIKTGLKRAWPDALWPDALKMFGLSEIAELSEATLLREYGRKKPMYLSSIKQAPQAWAGEISKLDRKGKLPGPYSATDVNSAVFGLAEGHVKKQK